MSDELPPYCPCEICRGPEKKGDPEMLKRFDPCKKLACAIQTCYRLNKHREWLCYEPIFEMMQCCKKNGPRKSYFCRDYYANLDYSNPIIKEFDEMTN